LACSSFRSTPQPLDFGVYTVCQRLLPFALGLKVGFLYLQEAAVVSLNSQQTFVIHAIQFDDFACEVFEQIAIVSDHNARERRRLQYRFQPLDAGKIEMMRRRTQPRALAYREVSAVRGDASIENLKQRGFARSIRTDQSDPIAFVDCESDVLEERRDAVFLR